MLEVALPGKDARVSLRPLDKANVRDICRLEVAPGQRELVAPNAVSLAQAYVHPEAWPRAIYADEVAVGFAMLEDWSLVPDQAPERYAGQLYVALWRFMVDARYQGYGYGTQALVQLIDHARSRPGATVMLLSFVPTERNAEPFYQRLGFSRTGEIDHGEVVMQLRL